MQVYEIIGTLLFCLLCRITQMIPLKCDIPVDFEFTLSFVQLHPAFTVEPMSGRILNKNILASGAAMGTLRGWAVCLTIRLYRVSKLKTAACSNI